MALITIPFQKSKEHMLLTVANFFMISNFEDYHYYVIETF